MKFPKKESVALAAAITMAAGSAEACPNGGSPYVKCLSPIPTEQEATQVDISCPQGEVPVTITAEARNAMHQNGIQLNNNRLTFISGVSVDLCDNKRPNESINIDATGQGLNVEYTEKPLNRFVVHPGGAVVFDPKGNVVNSWRYK